MVQTVNKNPEIEFLKWLGLMDFLQFHAFCGMLWNAKARKFVTWEFWPGVRGYPGQKDIAYFMQVQKILWILKARQLGLSEIAALYAFFIATTEPMSEIIIISKKEKDAKYFLKRRVLHKIKAAHELEYEPGKKFPWPKYQDFTDTGKIVFDNGSIIEAVSSDNEEVRSRTPRLVIFDEARSYSVPNSEELWSGILPAIESDPKGQLFVISTAKFGTWYNSTSKSILDGKMDGIGMAFIPADTHPMRTPEWREARKKTWTNKTLFLQEYPLKPEDCFTSREGAVFPQFETQVGGKHVNHVDLVWSRRFYIVYDHGRQHPAVMLLALFDKYENHLYVFDEVFCRGMDLPEIAMEIKKKINFYVKNHAAPPPQRKIADRACFSQDGRKPVSDILRDLTGITFTPSVKPDILDSLDDLSARMSNGGLTIDPRCVNTIRQISELAWKNDPTTSKREAPVDIEDDSVDDLRYLCADLRGTPKQKPPTPTLYSILEQQSLRNKYADEIRTRKPIATIEGLTAWEAG